MNTVKKGDRLRDDVHALLVAAGKDAVESEKWLAGKKCDVYYEERSTVPGRTLRFAVECKAYEAPLDRSLFGEIHRDYLAATDHFDFLIIITTNGLTSPVQESIRDVGWMVHQLYQGFCNHLLDLDRYLRGLRELFEKDGLNRYYEPVLDTDGQELEARVVEWVEGESDRPWAILAGYGMGKTSFSRRLAHRYADACLSGESFRAPIYIKLGELAGEQSLEGLICKHFTQENVVPGFSYPLFESFNRRGRFLIILDGFDEMKHAMSFEAFEFNVDQFRALVEPGARVLILGRPSAFQSDDEKASVLHGIELMGKERIDLAVMADFREIEVALFTPEQLSRFVERYIRYATSERDRIRGVAYDDNTIEGRIKEILDPRYQDLLARPVHAQMMITIALSTDEPLDRFSRHTLYEKFFALILRREWKKLARQGLDRSDRVRFARTVAWTAWTNGESGAIGARTLRRALREVTGSKGADDAQLREFVIGSVLESKPPNGYYFAHRSFIEFLCAWHLTETAVNAARLTEIADHVNAEILEFIGEGDQAERFAQEVLDALADYTGRMPLGVLRFLAGAANIDVSSGLVGASALTGPGPVLVHILALGNFDLDQIDRVLYKAFSGMSAMGERLALVLGVCRRARSCTEPDVLSRVAIALLGVLHVAAFDVISRYRRGRARTAAESDGWIWTRLLLESTNARIETNEVRALDLRIDRLEAATANVLADWLLIGDYEVAPMTAIDVPRPEWIRLLWTADSYGQTEEAQHRRRQSLFEVDSFWRSQPDLKDFVPVSVRSGPNPAKVGRRTLGLAVKPSS